MASFIGQGKLKEVDYPTVGTPAGTAGVTGKERPVEVTVFVVGGTTYEEARAVALHNQQAAKVTNRDKYKTDVRQN